MALKKTLPRKGNRVMMAGGGGLLPGGSTQSMMPGQVPGAGVIGGTGGQILNDANSVSPTGMVTGTPLGGLLGLNGGINGTGIAGPQGASGIMPLTSQDQINAQYGQTMGTLGQQQNLLSALQGQNGLGNQSQMYSQLQGIASGNGPNPAQAQYQANIQNLAAQQAGAISSQKGISPALANAQIARQSGSAMQNAAAQGAANTAQQQLGAAGAAANIANTQAGQQIGQTNANTSANLNEQANLLNAGQGFNQTQVGMQSNINNVNGQLANTTMQGQQGLIGGLMTGGGLLSSLAEGGEVTGGDEYGNFSSDVSSGSSSNSSTPSFGSDPAASSFTGGGKSGGGGGAAGLLALLANGGKVGYDNGGKVSALGFEAGPNATYPNYGAQPIGQPVDASQPQSMFGKFVSGVKTKGAQNTANFNFNSGGANALFQGMQAATKGLGDYISNHSGSSQQPQNDVTVGAPFNIIQYPPSGNVEAGPVSNATWTDSQGNYAKGGKVDALVSPGEKRLTPKQAKEIADGKKDIKEVGEKFPGKPKVKGNSYSNDVIPKKLTVGDIIIPNSVMQSRDPAQGAHDFVSRILANRKKR